MSVLQLVHNLENRPEVPSHAGLQLRHYAAPTDCDRWLALRELTFARQRLGVRSWSIDDFEQEILAKPWWNSSRMWLAELAGPEARLQSAAESSLIGSVILAQRGGDEAHAGKSVIHWLMVSPRHRRQGIGRLLLAAAEQQAWDNGARQVWLETHLAWAAAAKFYEAAGYHQV